MRDSQFVFFQSGLVKPIIMEKTYYISRYGMFGRYYRTSLKACLKNFRTSTLGRIGHVKSSDNP